MDVGLFCEDFECVGDAGIFAMLPVTSFSYVDVGITGALGATGTPGWRGGVLLPNGQILLTPANATKFVLVDVPTQTAGAMAQLDFAGEPAPRFGAAVLGCDGYVYALPDQVSYILRIDPATFELKTMQFDGGSISGAVVSDTCDGGLLHIAAATAGRGLDIAISAEPTIVHVSSFALQGYAPPAQPQGVVRNANVWMMPAPDCFTVGGAPGVCSGVLDGGYFGGAYVSPETIGVFNAGMGYFDQYNLFGLGIRYTEPIPAPRWPLARGDGLIYGATAGALYSFDPSSGTRLTVAVTASDAGAPNGLINAVTGEIVGPLDSSRAVRIFSPLPGAAPPAPREVLLSPFLNKL
jgi:hypothetical protein